MVLVDASVWIDHMRMPEPALLELLAQEQVLAHPFVIGELGMGTLGHRDEVLDAMRELPRMPRAYDDEVQAFVCKYRLFESGIGYLDAHLLVSVQVGEDVLLWSRDRRLRETAERLGLSWREPRAN